MDVKPEMYPGYTDEAHPECFNTEAMPQQPSVKKPGQLPESMIKQYFEKGYVIVEDFFKPEELEPCKRDIEKLVDEVAQKLYTAGKIKGLFKDYGFYERLTKLEAEFPGSTVLILKQGYMPKAFQQLWSNERLLNVVEQLIGPDIVGHPVWNLRSKVPKNEATIVPWHQDAGYLDNDSYKVMQPTAWIPLIDANEKNGCLQIASRGHKTGKIGQHQCCWGGTWYVMLEEEEMKNKLEIDINKDLDVCPVPYGGMVLFNNVIPHRSLPNVSKDIRWSLDLRWQRPTEPFGFYNLKDGVLMRSSKDPNLEIDWEKFNNVDRHQEQRKAMDVEPAEESEFDLTMPGPWMKKWEMVHMNMHTDRQKELDTKA
ncbi:putative alpha-ketoglutarate-dependent hypophosphite dioxygenase [Mytilus galloprovincialis]|uniref:putative alpha-ketoglutarate-dependent hypophosphite dioxygenase n=1 Tax=Mytilus galloprovincialis TaxID=29158 RepID=UPI003F7C057E